MQVEPTRMYRVKDVAEHFDVSASTIYRAVECGQLAALKLGAGQGTVRVLGSAVLAYAEICAQAAYVASVTDPAAGGGGVPVMRALMERVPEQPTTAQVNGHPVAVEQPHRRWRGADYTTAAGAPVGEEHEPVLVTVAAPVSLSIEDVAAVLLDWNPSMKELADDDTVRYLVAGTVISAGCLRIEELRCRLGEAALDPEWAAYLAYCRQRAAAVFGTCPAPRSGRALVGVR